MRRRQLILAMALLLAVPSLVNAQRPRTQQRTQGAQQGQQNVLTISVKGVSFKMVRVQGGTFTMGGTSEQGSDAYDEEKPTHQVTLPLQLRQLHGRCQTVERQESGHCAHPHAC